MTELERWHADEGDITHKVNYPLNPDSIVFDVGGYHGDWSLEMYARYQPWIHIFEPVPEYCEFIRKRFVWCKKIFVHDCGLSNRNFTAEMMVKHVETSLYVNDGSGTSQTQVKMADTADMILRYAPNMMSINAEGEEYNILSSIFAAGIAGQIQNIQIQFHKFDAAVNWEHKRDVCRNNLRQTHDVNYCYDDFIWESWKLK